MLETPSQFLSWQLHPPICESADDPEPPSPDWLDDVRSLRGAAFFDDGRRPQFKSDDGRFVDSDPIDFYAWHLLAYAGVTLVGCVRVYPMIGGGPPCLTELLVGAEQFSKMLLRLGKRRDSTIEIGRWVVDPALRAKGNLAPGIGVQLAAGAGSLALALVRRSNESNGVAIFSAGSRDRQFQMLSRLGLKPASEIEPVVSPEFDDLIRVMYCTSTHELQPRFQRLMDAVATTVGIDQRVFVCVPLLK
jgi:hypothetical protein